MHDPAVARRIAEFRQCAVAYIEGKTLERVSYGDLRQILGMSDTEAFAALLPAVQKR